MTVFSTVKTALILTMVATVCLVRFARKEGSHYLLGDMFQTHKVFVHKEPFHGFTFLKLGSPVCKPFGYFP